MEDNSGMLFFENLLKDDLEKKILKLIMIDGFDPEKDGEKILDILLATGEEKE